MACDVQTLFTDAAPVFGPQKGASPAQVDMLRGRLERLAQMYQEQYGVDVRTMPGTGAAGGLAGGLVALGGRLLPGFELVADELDLHDRVVDADLVITGEGYLDEQSFEGKVIGGVQAMCAAAGHAGRARSSATARPEVRDRIRHVSLARRSASSGRCTNRCGASSRRDQLSCCTATSSRTVARRATRLRPMDTTSPDRRPARSRDHQLHRAAWAPSGGRAAVRARHDDHDPRRPLRRHRPAPDRHAHRDAR